MMLMFSSFFNFKEITLRLTFMCFALTPLKIAVIFKSQLFVIENGLILPFGSSSH